VVRTYSSSNFAEPEQKPEGKDMSQLEATNEELNGRFEEMYEFLVSSGVPEAS